MSKNSLGKSFSDPNLKNQISGILSEYCQGVVTKDDHLFSVKVNSCWDLTISFRSRGGDAVVIRNLKKTDPRLLKDFREMLSNKSRELFCPYPWDEPDELKESFIRAITKSVDRIDASYIIVTRGQPIGHFFLWGASGNSHSLRYGVDIPELGVAISDAYQGQGLGLLAVRILQEVARCLGRDAVELTTALSNDAGWEVYKKAGFVYTGNIKNPLEVDVTLAVSGQVTPKKYREERQMIYIINPPKKTEILEYLKFKRNK